ncbi:MAG: hypothetical protein O2887_05665 [Bacteroidetes bacterium]|nr:hypothetical protein [Bacteroidota bacterium]MDA1119969.1 hypothetical protein [Bacteroidota bacterium]
MEKNSSIVPDIKISGVYGFLNIRTIIAGYVIFCTAILWIFDGTGDTGDSITHYLYAKYAFKYPEFFLHHWAKPIFMLLAAPFAQFDFIGIKIFNISMFLASSVLVYKLSKELRLNNAPLATLFCLISPLSILLVFSGLTEYTFNTLLILSIYLITIKRLSLSLLIVSFLPFVRPEGVLIIGVFGLFLILRKNYLHVFLLTIGHIVYSVAGASLHNDLFWVFTQNPNATLEIMYGAGSFLYFFVIEYHILGPIIYSLVFIGLFIFIRDHKSFVHGEIILLIIASFLVYFIAHGAFHYFGIFKSMGQKRVMIATTSLTAIIAIIGFNWLEIKGWRILGLAISKVFLILAILFPFSTLPGSISWKEYIFFRDEQKVAHQAADFIKENGLLTDTTRLFCNYPSIYLHLDRDMFDQNFNLKLNNGTVSQARDGDIIIWDSWFTRADEFFMEDQLLAQSNLKEIKRYNYYFKSEDWYFIVLKGI